MYIFIAIIFIAELIIAHYIISYLVKLDRCVKYYNACIESFNPLLQTCLEYGRCVVATFKNSFENFIAFVKKKQEQIIIKIILAIAIYSILLVFKIRQEKAKKVFKLASAIKDILLEFAI